MDTRERLSSLADKPEFVFPVYALVLTPLALYVYHDLLDTRWRPIYKIFRYLIAYLFLYVCSALAIILYIVIQGVYGKDYKEVGASGLALILGTYGAWKLVRLLRIIVAHRDLVKILSRIDASLASLTGLDPVGLDYHLIRTPPRPSDARHDFISSSLFDDDYPGEAAGRIKWLALNGSVRVLPDDAEECASRVALWMRLVLRRPRSEPWRLLTCSSPLVEGHIYRASLGGALRLLITYGSVRPPPPHASFNPAEILLNAPEDGDLTDAGVGFFWVASEMSSEEMSQVLSEMPPRWMRGVTQNGKQLMFELVMSLVLCEMPRPDDDALADILMLPVLKWVRDVADLNVWLKMSEICADAVVAVMPEFTPFGRAPNKRDVGERVRHAVFALQDATSDEHGFQGDTVGLTLIDLIRSSYRAGYLAEHILGSDLTNELARHDLSGTVHLYQAEVVTGLFSILTELGLTDNEDYQRKFKQLKQSWLVDPNTKDLLLALRERARRQKQESFSWDEEADSRYWLLSLGEYQCEDPAIAFGSVVTMASELAPFVYDLLDGYAKAGPRVCISANPERFREQWLLWKRTQAVELSGSRNRMEEFIRHVRVDLGYHRN